MEAIGWHRPRHGPLVIYSMAMNDNIGPIKGGSAAIGHISSKKSVACQTFRQAALLLRVITHFTE